MKKVCQSITYSYRNASIGLRREARIAGATPKIIPTAADTPKARATDAKDTLVGKALLKA